MAGSEAGGGGADRAVDRAVCVADLHLHTTASDGTLSPQALVNELLLRQMMEEPRLRVVAVTDHDTVDGALAAIAFLQAHHPGVELEVLVGAEVTSADGHILGLGLHSDVPKGMSAEETIDAIHEQGAIAIAAHPFAWFPFLKGLKGIKLQIRHPVVGAKLDAVEVCNANPTEVLNNHLARLVNRAGLRRPEVGGSDAHFQSAVGQAFTLFPGRTAADLLRAIAEGTTRAGGGVYGARAVWHYARDRAAWKRFCLADPVHRLHHAW